MLLAERSGLFLCVRSCHGARVHNTVVVAQSWLAVGARKKRKRIHFLGEQTAIPEGGLRDIQPRPPVLRSRTQVAHDPRATEALFDLTDTEIGRTWACRRHVPVSPHVHDRSSRVRRARDATKLNVLHMTRFTTLTRSECRMHACRLISLIAHTARTSPRTDP